MSYSPETPIVSDSEHVSKKKGKSAVLMKELIALRNSGIKLDVEFDENDEAIGKNGDKLKSYIGVLARTKVPIDISTWKDVKQDLKEKIWDEVLTIFNIPRTLTKKKQVISVANSRWTNFKSILTSLYIYKKASKGRKLPTDDNPLKKYPFIKADVWKRFVRSRLTAEFRAISEIASKKQKLNLYPHRMSRGGYRKTRIKLKAKLLATKDEDDKTPVIIERGDLWIEGRINKDGACLNSQTEQVIDKIKTGKEEALQGEFTPNGKDDILTKALGTKEHYGRVRGIGGLVGHKQYFGKCTQRRRGGINEFDIELLTKQITEKVRAETLKNMEFFFEQRTTGALEKMSMNENASQEDEMEVDLQSEKCSFQENEEHDPFAMIPDAGIKCLLAVMDRTLHNVALGKVFRTPNGAARSHCRAFGDNEARVSIDVVFEGAEQALLPVPTEEFDTVGEALASFVRWPKNLITFSDSKINQESEHGKMSKAKESEMLIDTDSVKTSNALESPVGSNTSEKIIVDKSSINRKLLLQVVTMMDESRPTSVELDKDVMGFQQTIYITKKDISQLLNLEELNISCIQTFLGYLHSIDDIGKYGFLCPQITSLIGYDVDQASTYICDTMIGGKKQLYLSPYYHEKHWMLAIMDIVERNVVYWFDPIGNSPPSEFKNLLNTSIRVFSYRGGIRKSSKVPQWINVDCARQPGYTECGFYVMRYMLEVVSRSDQIAPIDKDFQDIMPYSHDKVNEIQDLWTDYFLSV